MSKYQQNQLFLNQTISACYAGHSFKRVCSMLKKAGLSEQNIKRTYESAKDLIQQFAEV